MINGQPSSSSDPASDPSAQVSVDSKAMQGEKSSDQTGEAQGSASMVIREDSGAKGVAGKSSGPHNAIGTERVAALDGQFEDPFYLQKLVKARLIKQGLTQNKLSKELGVGVSSLSRWLNGLTAKMNQAYLVELNEIMLAWIENRERRKMKDKACWPGKGRKLCPDCKTVVRSNAEICKKCNYSFQQSELNKKLQSAIQWPEHLRRPRNESSRRAAEARRRNRERAKNLGQKFSEQGQALGEERSSADGLKGKKQNRGRRRKATLSHNTQVDISPGLLEDGIAIHPKQYAPVANGLNDYSHEENEWSRYEHQGAATDPFGQRFHERIGGEGGGVGNGCGVLPHRALDEYNNRQEALRLPHKHKLENVQVPGPRWKGTGFEGSLGREYTTVVLENGKILRIGDCVHLKSSGTSHYHGHTISDAAEKGPTSTPLPYIGMIVRMWEDASVKFKFAMGRQIPHLSKRCKIQWFYRLADTHLASGIVTDNDTTRPDAAFYPNEIFLSEDSDENAVISIIDRVAVVPVGFDRKKARERRKKSAQKVLEAKSSTNLDEISSSSQHKFRAQHAPELNHSRKQNSGNTHDQVPILENSDAANDKEYQCSLRYSRLRCEFSPLEDDVLFLSRFAYGSSADSDSDSDNGSMSFGSNSEESEDEDEDEDKRGGARLGIDYQADIQPNATMTNSHHERNDTLLSSRQNPGYLSTPLSSDVQLCEGDEVEVDIASEGIVAYPGTVLAVRDTHGANSSSNNVDNSSEHTLECDVRLLSGVKRFCIPLSNVHPRGVRRGLLSMSEWMGESTDVAKWSEKEHHMFLSLLPIFGKDFTRISKALPAKKLADIVAHFYYMKKKWGDSKLPKLREHASTADDQCSFCLGIFPDNATEFLRCAGSPSRPQKDLTCQNKLCSQCASLGVWHPANRNTDEHSRGGGGGKFMHTQGAGDVLSLDSFIQIGEQMSPSTGNSSSSSISSSSGELVSLQQQDIPFANRSTNAGLLGRCPLMCRGCTQLSTDVQLNKHKHLERKENLKQSTSAVKANCSHEVGVDSVSMFLQLSQRRWLCDRCTFCNSPNDSTCFICRSRRSTRNMLTYALLNSLQGKSSSIQQRRNGKRSKCQDHVGKRVRKRRRLNEDVGKAKNGFTAEYILRRNRAMLQESMSLLHSIKLVFLDEPNHYHKILDCLVRHAHGRAAAGDAVNTISTLLKGNPMLLQRFSKILRLED